MKKIGLITLLAFLILFTSCITIIEKYKINKNGSGTMEYIIDMSEMYEMMSAFSDSSSAADNPEIDQSMKAVLPGLMSMEGISDVELTGDITKYIAGIRFSFDNIKSLNKAMGLLLKEADSSSEDMKYVDFRKKQFTRYSLTADEFDKEKILGSHELDPETMKSVLESMKYKIIVSFEKPVKKVSAFAQYTQEGNTVTIEANFSDIFDKPDILQAIIKTK
jgi:hypothetical protein